MTWQEQLLKIIFRMFTLVKFNPEPRNINLDIIFFKEREMD